MFEPWALILNVYKVANVHAEGILGYEEGLILNVFSQIYMTIFKNKIYVTVHTLPFESRHFVSKYVCVGFAYTAFPGIACMVFM